MVEADLPQIKKLLKCVSMKKELAAMIKDSAASIVYRRLHQAATNAGHKLILKQEVSNDRQLMSKGPTPGDK